MSQHSTSTTFSSIEEALEDLRQGRFIVLVDDEDRENEGDLVCAAESITPEQVNFMVTEGRGTLCVTLTRSRCERLSLTPQASENSTPMHTAFTVTVDAAPSFGVTTGISTADRATTIRQLISEDARASDFVRPGHINPLTACDGGVLVRAGQTEGSVDLCRLAGLMPAAAIIEILNPDGTMARVPDLIRYCDKHDLKLVSIADLIEYRLRREQIVERAETVPIHNEYGRWSLSAFKSPLDDHVHLSLSMGGVGEPDEHGNIAPTDEPVLIRVHSECLTGDAFGSMRCECGPQLHAAMAQIAKVGRGVIVYLRQEGRGIGLLNKLHAYRKQDEGLDTVDANLALGLPIDKRDYGIGAQILRNLGVQQIRILTNNPKKVARLNVYGLEVVEQLPLEIPANPYNARYLQAKHDRMGHTLETPTVDD